MSCKNGARLCFFLAVLLFAGKAKAQDIDKIRAQIRVIPDDTNKVNLYKQAVLYYRRDDIDSAYLLAGEGLKLAEKIKFAPGEAHMWAQLGIIDRVQGRQVSAKARLQNALDIYAQLRLQRSTAHVDMELGTVEAVQGNYDAATRYLLASLKIFESLNDTDGMAQAYVKLGVVHGQIGNLKKSGTYYMMSLDLGRNMRDTLTMAYAYNNMCINEGKQEHYDTALVYCASGLSLCVGKRNTQFRDVEASLLLNAGIIYNMQGDEQKALGYFNQALVLAKEHHRPSQIPNLLLNIALLEKATPADKKEPMLKEALTLAQETDQQGLVADIYEGIADLYEGRGDYKGAYLYKDSSVRIRNKMFTLQKNNEIANLQALYDLDKSHNKVLQLELQGSERKLQRNVTIVVALVILMALIGVTVIYRRTIVLNTELKKGKEELAEANMIKDKMFSILGHDLRTPTHTIIGMLRVLDVDNNDIDPAEQRKIYGMLRYQSEASLETLNKLLLWGNRQIKGISLQMEQFDVADVIQGNLRLLHENAAEKLIAIYNKVPEAISIYADTSHFDFVVRNLISNAIKFSHSDSQIEIGVAEQKDGFVTFYVKDYGVGVKPEVMDNIFSLNSESTLGTENEKGTGLGLVLCRDFVELDGGKIWLTSENGNGTTFFFTFRDRPVSQ